MACSNTGKGGRLRAACSYRSGRGGGMLKPGEERGLTCFNKGWEQIIMHRGEGEVKVAC